MSLRTHSKFYYGFEVTSDFQFLDFDEGAGELSAELQIGSYSFEDFLTEVERALNEAGTLTYTVTGDRATRIVTVSATAGFSLLVASGSHLGTSAFGIAGFSGADRASAVSHDSNLAAGSEYSTQFILQSYIDPADQVGATYGTVNKSASGKIEVVSFGSESIAEFNIKFVNDYELGDGSLLRNRPSGVADLRALMTFLIGKGPFEFMPDENDPNAFFKMILESTPDDSKGLKFKLKEQYSQGLPGYFETGVLKARLVD